MIEYRWKPGAQASRLDPQVVGDHLANLAGTRASLTPAEVVADARKKRSPLHKAFEWDDAIAAEHHRLAQARNLLNHIVIVRTEAGPSVIRAYVVTSADDESRYTGTETALSDPELRQQVLSRAMRELASFRAKYRDLKELSEIFAAIDGLAVAG